MMSGSFVSLNYACEESVVDYLIAQCDPLEVTASYYTGQGNVAELQAPAVVVNAEQAIETYPLSNVYDITVMIGVKELGADAGNSPINSTNNPSLGVLGASIYNAICNPSMSYAINTNNSRSFCTQFVQKLDNRHSVNKDALISDYVVRIIGSISGSI